MTSKLGRWTTLALSAVMMLTTVSTHATGACTRCGWVPPSGRSITVGSVAELMDVVSRVPPFTTILLKDGEYRLPRMLDLPVQGTVLRARSGDRSKVMIRGDGMTERQVGVAISVSAADIVIADVSIGHVGYHGIQVRGEASASRVVMHNVRVVDAGQQLVKITASRTAWADDGVLACSLLEYTDHAPSNYTNGIDALAAKGWVVRDNRFVRIRGPRDDGWRAGPAVLFWAHSIGTIVERNLVLDSFRGIALGLLAAANPDYGRPGDERFDHYGGSVRNNVICNLHPWADEGIELNSAGGVEVDHNTVLAEGSLTWSISARFPASAGFVRNNLTNRQVILRDGAEVTQLGNVSHARREWFIAPETCDLRLADSAEEAMGTGVSLPAIADDFDRHPRPASEPDVGAFQRRGEGR